MNFIAVPPDAIEMAWPELSKGIEGLLKINLGTDTKGKVYRECTEGRALMFAMYEAGEPVVVIVADITQGDELIFNVQYCWGTRVDDWIDEVYNAFEIIAKQAGCGTIVFNGRLGWRKLARQYGFRVNTMIYVKELI
jgi:hypothetical protein